MSRFVHKSGYSYAYIRDMPAPSIKSALIKRFFHLFCATKPLPTPPTYEQAARG
jgi:hypothetical protein